MNAAQKFTIAICTFALSGALALAQDAAPAETTPPAQTPPASAPNGQHRMHGDPVAMRLHMMSQKLNLTDDQKAKIQPILQSEFQQARTIRQNQSLTPDQQKAQLEQLRQTTRDQTKQLLTPEQVAQMGKGPEMGKGGPGGPRGPEGGPLAWMSKNLNLTDDQKAKIQPILQSEFQQARTIHQNQSLTPDQQKAQLQQLRQTTRDQVKQILTPEQVAKLGNGPFMGNRPEMSKDGPGGPEGGPLAWMSKTLNLTDQQKAQLQPLFDNQHKQVLSVMQDSSLTPEQKRAKAEEIHKATHQQVLALLTPEQQTQLQNQMKQMRGHHMHRPGPGAPPEGAPSGDGATPPPTPPGA